MKVIVTDGLWRKSLSAVRSLGKAGYDISVLGDSIFTTSFWSRYTKRRQICPSAKDDAFAFGEALLSLLKKNEGEEKPVLLPMEDATLDWISANRNELSRYSDFLLPQQASLEIAQSKAETIRFAAQLGLATPETIFVSDREDLVARLHKLRVKEVLHKYIVKPVSGSGSTGIIYLDSASLPDWNEHWERYGPMIIQKRVAAEGQGLGVSMLFDHAGACVAHFAHGRLQEYPNKGGPSTSRVSIYAPVLVENSERLLKALNWRGVAMVEWKADPEDNVPKILEINPRFWGSLELAVRSGVNFPLIYTQVAKRQEIMPQQEYRIGVICRWLLPGELLRYATQQKDRRESIREFLHGLPRSAEEWDKDDFQGFLSSIVCPAITVLKPKYWKYLTR